MFKRLSVFIILSGICLICHGQKLLFHKNSYRNTYYEVGDIISFRLNNEKIKRTGQIIGFEDNMIVLQAYRVDPNQITHFYFDEKTKVWYILRFKYAKIFTYAGIGYPIIDLINTGALSKETLIIGSTFVAAGLLAKLLIPDNIKIKGRRKLLIVE